MTFNLTRSFQIQIESPYFKEYIHLILINLALTLWILFVVTFYDRLLALLLGRLLLTRYIKSKRVKSSLGSISFGIFAPRLVVRDLKIRDLGQSWSFVIDQFEIGLNQLKNSLLDRKLFHIQLRSFQLVLDETAADSNYCQINQLFQLNLFENSVLDFQNLSILVYNSANLKSFHLSNLKIPKIKT